MACRIFIFPSGFKPNSFRVPLFLSAFIYYTNHMNTYILLFRGINVGGKNTIKMKELVSLLEDLGLFQVQTYIQSGNVVFEADADVQRITEKIKPAIQEQIGFAPQLLLLSLDQFEAAIQNNPFPQAESNPKTLHLGFLAQEPEHSKLEELERLKTSTEEFLLKGRVFYLYAPDGIGRSKLAASSERLLGVPMTMRNWNSVMNILALTR